MTKIKASDMQLRDVIQLYEGPYSTATVTNVEKDRITWKRPYGHTSGYSMVDGVIFYTGLETGTLFTNGSSEYLLLERHHCR